MRDALPSEKSREHSKGRGWAEDMFVTLLKGDALVFTFLSLWGLGVEGGLLYSPSLGSESQ